MARFVLNPSSTNEPVFDHVKRLVRLRKSLADIVSRVKSTFKRVRETTILSYISYWRGTQDAARRLNQSGTGRQLSEVIVSSRRSNPKVVRASYTFEFNDPKQGGYRRAGFSFDISIAGDKGNLINRIKEAMRNWLLEHYQLRDTGRVGSVPRTRNMEIRELEGI